GTVDGHPHAAEAGEVVVEGPGEDLGPEADHGAAGRQHHERHADEPAHDDHDPRIDGWTGRLSLTAFSLAIDTRSDFASAFSDAGMTACTALGTFRGGLTPRASAAARPESARVRGSSSATL